ncbi:Organic cation transporter 1like [Caligus rogercresseyi]|uniref:Organic cation transporter 1like n=1 Tax=Caligus rogercresseyi TaxID=217165 RepID=A0A7T8KAK1_CALRO|nr:Organic cation transporter 1like [Caligus rogercresseyi]
MSEGEELGMDYILTHLIVFFAFIADIAGGIPLLLHMFTAFAPDHRCSIPVCDASNNTEWMDFAYPLSQKSSNFLKTDTEYDTCQSFKVIDENGGCEKSNFNASVVESCEDWIYDQSEFEYTLSTEHDLVCGAETKRRILSTIMMLGLMIGSLVGGKLGDWIGRKKTCFIAVAVTIPAITIGGYAPNYEVYATLRLLTCTCLPCIWVSIHSLTFELFGMKGREKFLAVKDLFYPLYVIMLGGLSFIFRRYEELHLVSGALCVLSLLMYFFIPESVRWQVENNQYGKARETLMRIAQDNGKIHDDLQEAEGKGKHQIWDMFRKSQIRMTLILLVNWITINVGSYTLTLEATKLSGNIWLNFVLSALIELPGSVVIYLFLSLLGRRHNLFMYQTIHRRTPNILSGKIGAGAGFLMVWILPVELYPTNLRAQALGTLSTCILCAYVGQDMEALPLLIIGVPIPRTDGIRSESAPYLVAAESIMVLTSSDWMYSFVVNLFAITFTRYSEENSLLGGKTRNSETNSLPRVNFLFNEKLVPSNNMSGPIKSFKRH